MTPAVIGDESFAQAESESPENKSGFIYRIGPEDELQIEVRGEEELSRRVLVRPDGRITLPLIGDVPAVGRSPEALQAEITEALEAYITAPQVQVSVVQATGTFPDRIRIIGEAVTPRSLPFREGMSALDAITEIGGLPPEAAANSAYLLRGSGASRQEIPLRLGRLVEQGRLSADRSLQPGDIIVIPEGFFGGDVTFEPSLGIAQTYTDNVGLDPSSFRDAALISELIPSLQVDIEAARISAALDATLRLQYLAETDIEDFQLAPDVTGVANVEFLEDILFTDFSASITRDLIDTQRGGSINQANVQNQRVTQTYRASPYIQGRLGRFARVEARYIGEAVFIDQGQGNRQLARGFNANDSIENTGRVEFESGPRFSTLSWTLSGEWSDIDLENRPDRRRREALLRTELAVSPSLTLIAEGGWEDFEGNDFRRDIDDPVGLGGFRWTPSPRTELEALGGFDDGDEAFRFDLRQDIGQALSLVVSFDERADIDQGRLGRALPQVPDDLDNPLDGGTDLTLRGDPTRTETLIGSLTGRIGTTTAVVTGRYEDRELGVLGGENDEEVVSVTTSLTQPLSRNFVLSASGSFENRTFAAIEDISPARDDDTYFANAGLTYSGFQRLDISLRYTFSKRDSSQIFQDFRENAVTLTITAGF